MADINLLPKEEEAAAGFEALRKKLTIVSVVILVLTAGFTLATLALFTSYAKTRTDLETQAQESLVRIDSLKATEELIVVVKGKISTATKILAVRTNTAMVFEKIGQLTPAGVYFTDMRFNAGKVVMSGRARTSADVSALVSALTSAAGAEILTNISVDSLSSDETGSWVFVISGGKP